MCCLMDFKNQDLDKIGCYMPVPPRFGALHYYIIAEVCTVCGSYQGKAIKHQTQLTR